MTQNTNIEWADHTFNPWHGCTKVSPACDNCYAAAINKRFGGDNWGTGKPRQRTSEKNWLEPLKWNAQADTFFAKHGRRQRVFCASMADVFDNEVDKQWRMDLFRLIHKTPNIDWLLLTKRIGNAEQMMRDSFGFVEFQNGAYSPLPNVWLGATICNQKEANRDISTLMDVPAAKRFLSIEPMLSEISIQIIDAYMSKIHDFYNPLNGRGVVLQNGEDFDAPADYPKLDWIICGGESGHDARPMHPDWARSLRDQCAAAGVPFFFKQWGDYSPHPIAFNKKMFWLEGQTGCAVPVESSEGDVLWQAALKMELKNRYLLIEKVGKKAAGRLLDGVEHNGVPV